MKWLCHWPMVINMTYACLPHFRPAFDKSNQLISVTHIANSGHDHHGIGPTNGLISDVYHSACQTLGSKPFIHWFRIESDYIYFPFLLKLV